MPRPEARDPGPTPAGGAGGLPAVGAWPPRTRWPEPLHRAVAAVREALAGDGSCRADAGPGRAGNRPRGLVALSGGADSLALAVACAVLVGTRDGARLGPIGAAVVDHGLQSGSDAVAAAAADVARILGLAPVTVTRVEVARTGDGPEADARRARRVALAAAARDARPGGAVVLTAHTADDQAEQVLLGLARGSGTRSLAGIPARGTLPGGAAVVRPLLGLARADTEAICRWAGLTWFEDPHNRDPALLRSRVRTRVLPALEDPDAGLGPGVRVGLVRTAAIAAEDAAALDAWAGDEFTRLRVDPPGRDPRVVSLDLDALAALPAAVRHRVIARAARAAGGQAPPRERILAVDALVTGARAGGTSAGPVELPGGVAVHRACARLDLIPCLPGP
ncbi:tRNA lysidine(34) synthetase TilS [Micrococcus luteus]|uniref:tRNA lysidine(34) synthetase TilS n=1 Tax=Micrococcus luteus TaxID=1270 RepID=UPI000BA71BF9|nr:tRNA lysidine(34) synthetase TilS [Micrococcus luteus]MCV7681900.1 tRNA lysidine(34) synthetase TilS [Micrococcus luteus]PAL17290.1 tRNA lysidine(34) synthetase TilS [Micrococcus luteus]